MTTPAESRAALALVSGTAVALSGQVLDGSPGSSDARRLTLLNDVPQVISYYSDGSSALAADLYDDERERQRARGRFVAAPVVLDRTVKIRRGIAWASEPMFDGDLASTRSRLAEIVQLNVARPYRDTILTARRLDPEAVGWKRIARGGGCKFCQMLAANGAIYSEKTVRFAAHDNCQCTAAPVFRGGEIGPEASAEQYLASKRTRTEKEKSVLRSYLNTYFPDASG